MANAAVLKRVRVIGPMPPYPDVAETLWGKGIDFDSDGDSSWAGDPNWRELTVIRRPDYDERVDIDPPGADRDLLSIESTSAELVDRVVAFLTDRGAIEPLSD